jgi:excisionase family DNA binding protein
MPSEYQFSNRSCLATANNRFSPNFFCFFPRIGVFGEMRLLPVAVAIIFCYGYQYLLDSTGNYDNYICMEENMIEDNRVYTAQEVADKLRISIQTVIRELKEGKLKGAKIRGQWRIWENDLNDYVVELRKDISQAI